MMMRFVVREVLKSVLCRDWHSLVQGEVKVDISIEASVVAKGGAD